MLSLDFLILPFLMDINEPQSCCDLHLNLIEKKVGKAFECIFAGDNSLNSIPMAQDLRSNIDKWDLMKLRPGPFFTTFV